MIGTAQQATPVAANATMKDTITLLRAKDGERATKLWKANGEIEGYGNTAHWTVKSVAVSSIHGMHKFLAKIEADPSACVVRGRFIGDAQAQDILPPEYPGHYRRRNVLFNDEPLHLMMIDIDGYMPPAGIDPVAQPVTAINAYVETHLPDCFQGITYCWQLSSSAGAPKYKDVLKAHVWFWLDQPYTSAQLKAWAKSIGTIIDSSVFQKVQVHYTARPVFESGAVDPAPVRIGLEEGWAGDSVDLVISNRVLAKVVSIAAEDDIDLVDPKEKKGVIGAFCRAFTMEQVIERWLSGVFQFDEDDGDARRRLTYLQGGGSKGGAFITPCREYIVNKHNTDPLDNRASNKFDLVRVHCFGHLDAGADPILLVDVMSRPSYEAVVEMMRDLPEVRGQLNEVKQDALRGWLDKIDECIDPRDLQTVVQTKIAQERLTPVDRAQIEQAIKNKMLGLGVVMRIDDIRRMMNPRNGNGNAAGGVGAGGPVGGAAGAAGVATEPWCADYVWCQFEDAFVHVPTSEAISKQSFNAAHNRDVGPQHADQFGNTPPASVVALDVLQLPVVSRRMYLPYAGQRFTLNGLSYLNRYLPSSVPDAKDQWEWDQSDEDAVEVVRKHIENLLGPVEATILIQYLAYCVQNPGKKIRWAPLIKGIEGDGKSLIGELMARVMGPLNVKVISPKVLLTDFNGFAEGSCIGILEELKMAGHNRHDAANAMKPNITNDTVAIHRKGVDEYNVINVTNYIGFTNHNDALPLTDTDRRWWVVFSRYADPADLPGADYFDTIFDALRQHSAALRAWLLMVDVGRFNPNGRAPYSAAKASMVAANMHEDAEAVEEAIEAGVAGISKDVISTSHLTDWLAMNAPDVVLKGRTMSALLLKMGWMKLPKQIKWRGKPVRVWVKDVHKVTKARAMLDATVTSDASEFCGEVTDDLSGVAAGEGV